MRNGDVAGIKGLGPDKTQGSSSIILFRGIFMSSTETAFLQHSQQGQKGEKEKNKKGEKMKIRNLN